MYTVYRFENDEGHGPYTGNGRSKFLKDCLKAHNGKSHPGAMSDMGFSFVWDTRLCACESPDKLYEWFGKFHMRREISACGFKLIKYVVKELTYSKSGKQCAFEKEDVISRTILFK